VFDAVQLEGHGQVRIDRTRDALLTDFGKATLDDRYLLPGESYQDLFARVASAYGDDAAHAQRIYDYISRLWFMPATPVLSNGGTTRGLPISCFLNEASDSLDGIVGLWNENVWLAAKGGGIGAYSGNLRSIGEQVGRNGKTSGVIPFIRVMDSLTLAISQGSLRRGSAACYLPVNHPEIEEFLEMRRPTGGDPNRKALNLHHGILIPDAFMRERTFVLDQRSSLVRGAHAGGGRGRDGVRRGAAAVLARLPPGPDRPRLRHGGHAGDHAGHAGRGGGAGWTIDRPRQHSPVQRAPG
jgi:ribonucleoside-diphosphate reductase alpha chain